MKLSDYNYAIMATVREGGRFPETIAQTIYGRSTPETAEWVRRDLEPLVRHRLVYTLAGHNDGPYYLTVRGELQLREAA